MWSTLFYFSSNPFTDLTPGAALPAASGLFCGSIVLFYSMYTSILHSSNPSANAFLLFTHVYKPRIFVLPVTKPYYYFFLILLCFWCFFCASFFIFLSWFIQSSPRNAGDLRAKSVELLNFVLLFPVNLIRNQESYVNNSSYSRIFGYSALRSDCSHSRSGCFSADD